MFSYFVKIFWIACLVYFKTFWGMRRLFGKSVMENVVLFLFFYFRKENGVTLLLKIPPKKEKQCLSFMDETFASKKGNIPFRLVAVIDLTC